MLEQFRNGVFFVSLAPIRDWELVVPTILRTLGLREQPGETPLETLTEYLGEKELLLVLDNFEHVLAAAPAVAGLLEAAPDLQVLVTSRMPLRLQAEHAHRVPQLAVPDLRRPRSPRRSWTSSRCGCSSSGRAARPPTSPSAT